MLALIAAALALTVTSGAHAQSTGALRFGALRSDARTSLSLEEEVVELDCTAPAPDAGGDTSSSPMPCTVRVHWALHNPGAEAVVEPLHVTIENASDPFSLGDVGAEGRAEAPVLTARRFPFDGDATRTLELSGEIELLRAAPPGLAESDALRARHPLLASGQAREVRGVIYTRAVARHFLTATTDVVIRARVPAGFVLHVEGDGVSRMPNESVDGWTVLRVHREGGDADPHVTIEILPEGDDLPIRNGGPFLALGGVALAPQPLRSVFWARLGYEIGFVDWLIVSAAIEGDFAERLAVGLMLEAGSPSFGLPPSFSVGLGSAIRILPTPAASLRLAAGATIFAVGFEALFDYFPVDDGFTITLLGRVGL